MDVPEHQTKMMNLSLGSRNEVRVDAENGECVLHLDPPASLRNFALHLPSYDQLLTPINGAYFLIITVIIFGATWACCSFRNRRRQAGIPYQELEMSAPESASANNVEVAEVWDQDWDDDWDEENAVRSPALRHGISVNGLTSRSTNKDG
ncbi:hypothetical protein Tsubulata_000136 [Turnera subulata]|uniref:Uncharacterized protein n=1 Tax=Turnera subulata TaxID=218843 RepID=A0A9Q0FJD3_9ROSI|nr:hypothetical protein Tsubulata_000136 [Turnera subulata]